MATPEHVTTSHPIHRAADSEMARRIAAFDWSATAFGPIESWSPELRTAAALCLNSQFAAALYWGPDWAMLYNDEFVHVLGNRTDALGRPAAEVWGPYWRDMHGELEQVSETGIGISVINKHFELADDERPREEFWNYSFTPVHDSTGAVAGIFAGARQTTDLVLQRRFDALIIALDEQLAAMDAVDDIIDSSLRLIGEHLGVKRTGFGEIDREARMLHIRRCWTSGDMPDICGRYPLGTFGAISTELAEGKSVRIVDNLSDERTRDPATIAAYERIGLRSGIVTPIIDRGAYQGGVFVQDNIPRVWTGPQTALVEAATARLWQAVVRARAQAALRDSEERFRLIFDQANDIIFTADIDQRITATNPAGARALGYEPSEIIGRSISDFVSPEDFEQTTAMLQHKIDKGGHTRHEVGVTGRDGKTMRWENDSTLVIDRDSRPIGLLSISRDVTERRAFEERRELLIHELNHRVKNTLSLVQGIAHQSFRGGSDPVAAPAEFEARLSALAAAHDLLTRDQWEGSTLAELVRAATAPIGGTGSRVSFSGPSLTVTPKAAVALVMALHELATNAVKYGALSVSEGRVHIVWSQQDNDCFRLVWTERDGPPVAVPTRRGFGVRMIERALASDLGGKVTIDFAPAGLVCTIDAPIEGRPL